MTMKSKKSRPGARRKQADFFPPRSATFLLLVKFFTSAAKKSKLILTGPRWQLFTFCGTTSHSSGIRPDKDRVTWAGPDPIANRNANRHGLTAPRGVVGRRRRPNRNGVSTWPLSRVRSGVNNKLPIPWLGSRPDWADTDENQQVPTASTSVLHRRRLVQFQPRGQRCRQMNAALAEMAVSGERPRLHPVLTSWNWSLYCSSVS